MAQECLIHALGTSVGQQAKFPGWYQVTVALDSREFGGIGSEVDGLLLINEPRWSEEHFLTLRPGFLPPVGMTGRGFLPKERRGSDSKNPFSLAWILRWRSG